MEKDGAEQSRFHSGIPGFQASSIARGKPGKRIDPIDLVFFLNIRSKAHRSCELYRGQDSIFDTGIKAHGGAHARRLC
jgi:hypothetical protein